MIAQEQFDLVIYGCGGHARSVADVALFNGIRRLIFVDERGSQDERILGFTVVPSLDIAPTQQAIIGIGDNKKRAHFFLSLQEQGNFSPLISRRAPLGYDAQVQSGTFVGHDVYLGPQVRIGRNNIINTRCVIEHECIVGDHCHVSVNATLAGKVRIGNFVMIGAGATVIDGVHICDHVIVGAGATVVHSIDEPGTYVGCPAKRIK